MTQNLSNKEIRAVLAMQPPLLLLDTCSLDTDARTATATKCISMNDPVFQGHFPGHPILPGVLQVIAMQQTATVLAKAICPENAPVALTALRRVKFRAPVEPGRFLSIQCKAAESQTDGNCDFEVKCTLDDGSLASSAILTLSQTPLTPVPADAQEVSPANEEQKWLRGAPLLAMLPHRFPFFHLDGVCVAEAPEGPHFGYKCISSADPFVSDYFPSPIQIEAAAQLGCASLLSRPENQGKLGFFMSIDEAHFHHLVVPGDKLFLDIRIEQRGAFGLASGKLSVRGTPVADANIKFALVDKQ